jgi:hypothetical protein
MAKSKPAAAKAAAPPTPLAFTDAEKGITRPAYRALANVRNVIVAQLKGMPIETQEIFWSELSDYSSRNVIALKPASAAPSAPARKTPATAKTRKGAA